MSNNPDAEHWKLRYDRLLHECEGMRRQLATWDERERSWNLVSLTQIVDERDALRAEKAVLAKDAAAGRALWKFLLEEDIAWGEDQDTFIAMGLLARTDMTQENAPPPCRNCNGDCDVCYRPTDLLSGAAIDNAMEDKP